MRKLLIVVTSLALTASAAMAENAVGESQKRLAELWDGKKNERTVASETGSNVRSAATMRDYGRGSDAWHGNYRGGRMHPPAGH